MPTYGKEVATEALETKVRKSSQSLQVQQLAKKDDRLKLISEVLNGIKVYIDSGFCLLWKGLHTIRFLFSSW